jgi:hypothetical protein
MNIKFVIISVQHGLLASEVVQYHPEVIRKLKHLDFLRIRTIDGILCDVLLWSPESIEELMSLLDNISGYHVPIIINKDTPANWIKEDRDYDLHTIQILDVYDEGMMVYPGEDENMENTENDDEYYE